MAFYSGTKTNQNLVFGNKGEIRNLSFASSEAVTVASTEHKILASDGSAADQFGHSVAIGNGRIVVGVLGDNSFQGSAYIFDLDGTQLAKITASDGASGDQFGISVDIGNGRIVVGARYDNVGANPNQGSAYIFDLNGNQLAKITASDGASDDAFGSSVAVGNGRIVVGATDAAVGANTNQGCAYIFDLDGTQLAKITASDGDIFDYFGSSVAVGNGRIVVGDLYDNVGVNTNQGSAYIFDLDGTQLAKITASDGSAFDYFGTSVAIGNGRIVVGANEDNSIQGSAYIFDLDGTELTKITASDGAINDRFGYSVAIGNGRIVVGAYGDDDNGSSSGSTYIFDLNGTQLTKITASDGASDDYFGISVAVGNGHIVVGVPFDNDNGSSSGSAYIYNTNEYYDDYVEKIADNKIGQYTRLTG